jgi:hypothetical protein
MPNSTKPANCAAEAAPVVQTMRLEVALWAPIARQRGLDVKSGRGNDGTELLSSPSPAKIHPAG